MIYTQYICAYFQKRKNRRSSKNRRVSSALRNTKPTKRRCAQNVGSNVSVNIYIYIYIDCTQHIYIYSKTRIHTHSHLSKTFDHSVQIRNTTAQKKNHPKQKCIHTMRQHAEDSAALFLLLKWGNSYRRFRGQ